MLYFRVRARNDHGASKWTTAETFVSPPAPLVVPGVPLNVKLSESVAAERSSLAVVWDEPPDEGGSAVVDYDVRYCDTTGSCDEETGWVEWNPDAADSTDRTATIDNLTPDTEYQIQVRAANSAGEGAWSNAGAGRTEANQAPIIDGAWIVSLLISRSLPTGSDIHLFTASDPDGDTITWTTSASADNPFTINTATGQLQTGENLSYATQVFFVTATDDYGATDNAMVVINFKD